jgi:hypothetical protein
MTAVEWLVDQFEKDGYLGIQRIEQAKKMEKWQIIHAWNGGVVSIDEETAEDFYNENYKK